MFLPETARAQLLPSANFLMEMASLEIGSLRTSYKSCILLQEGMSKTVGQPRGLSLSNETLSPWARG